MNKRHTFLFLLTLALLLCGCASSTVEDPISQLGTDTDSRVPHQSWGFYRLYQYQDGTWTTVFDRGQPTGGQPVLGDTPVVIVHGLGSTIVQGRFSDMADNLIANGATSVFGFEYDTLDPIATNGTFFGQALGYLTTDETDRTFRIMAHSMGALVVRTQTESGQDFQMADQDNLISFVAGPHLGSEVAAELAEGPSDIVEEALTQIILNGELSFFNAAGTPVDVTGEEPSFAELAPGSSLLASINTTDAATSHPQFLYRTLAGDQRGEDLETFNRILGVFADDGLVNVQSANATVIGPTTVQTVPFDHSSIIQAQPAILVILDQLNLI